MTRYFVALLTLALSAAAAQAQCATYRAPQYRAPVYHSSYGHSYVTPYHEVVKAAVVVKKEVIVEKPVFYEAYAVIPIVRVRAYGAVYDPPPQPQPVPPQTQQGPSQGPPQPQTGHSSSNDFKQIMDALKANTEGLKILHERIDRLEKAGPNSPPFPQGRQEQKAPPKEQSNAPAQDGKGASEKVIASNKKSCAACHQKGSEQHGGDVILSNADGSMTEWDYPTITGVARHVNRGTMPKLNARAKQHGITEQLGEEDSIAWLEESFRQEGRLKAKSGK